MAPALIVPACSDVALPTTPTSTTTTIIFASRLLTNGFAWRSFTVAAAGTVTVQLVSLSPETDAVVDVGFGQFGGTDCTITTRVQSAPQASDPQITAAATAGNYCVRVADIGNLTKAADFAISIVIK